MPELENKADKIFETLWSDNEFREYTGNNNIPLEFIINLVDKVSELANEQLEKEIKEMKNFVKSMYKANENDAYCREYLGTILNEWDAKDE